MIVKIIRVLFYYLCAFTTVGCSYNTIQMPQKQMQTARASAIPEVSVVPVPIDSVTVQNIKPQKYIIMPNDSLYILVKPTTDDVGYTLSGSGTPAVLNQSINNQLLSPIALANGSVDTNSGRNISVYTVDEEGGVSLPYIGYIKLSDLTLIQAKAKIKLAVKKYIKNANVQITPASAKNRYVNVIGDVKQNTVIPVTNENVTLSEALTLSGGLNDNAKVKEVYVLRMSNESNTILAYNLDASNAVSFIYAQKFYMHPDDIVYVSRDGFSQFSNIMQKLSPLLQDLFYAKLVVDPNYFALFVN